MNDRAEIKQYRIKHTLINSNRRLNYDEAQAIIESGRGCDEVEEAVLNLNRLSKLVRDKRFADGAINFERQEVKFDIDENGKPLRAYFREDRDAEYLIEEFMLLANKTVAGFIGKILKGVKAKTFVYRVHDKPNPEKMANLTQFVRRLGYKMKDKRKKNETSRDIIQLLNEVQGKKEQNLIEVVAIRTMAKATYTTVNIGHFGLAFDYYTHFTSPIRRYPDMMVHRLVDRYLTGGRSVPQQKTEDNCKHCSNMEALASQAERASIKYKQVEFMSDKVGMVFDGIISGVTEWGLYVELNETHCEGLVPIRELTDDYYEFDEETYSLTGNKTKNRYRLGDSIRIRVVRANLEKKQLDFTLE
jgi:ribonuclease R